MKKRRLKFKTKVIICIVVAAIITIIAVFFNNATAVILSVGSARLRALNTQAVTQAAAEAFGDTSYEDIVAITYDDNGDVAAITAQSSRINAIARNTAYLTQTIFGDLSSGGIEIPVGAFTGIEALAGYGATVNVKIIPVASAECSFVSRFTHAGINQTIHSIYIEVVTQITIVLAARAESVLASAEVLVCESIINGEVPQIYLQGGLLGSGSLVP